MNYLSRNFDFELSRLSENQRFEKIITGAEQLLDLGNVSDALSFLEAALEMCRSLDDWDLTNQALWRLALAHFENEDYEDAADKAAHGVLLAESNFDELAELQYAILLADSQYLLNNWVMAYELFNKLKLSDLLDARHKSLIFRRLGAIELERGDSSKNAWLEALDASFESGHPGWITDAAIGSSQAFRLENQPENAHETLLLALSSAEDTGHSSACLRVAIEALECFEVFGPHFGWETIIKQATSTGRAKSTHPTDLGLVECLEIYFSALISECVTLDNQQFLVRKMRYLQKLSKHWVKPLDRLISQVQTLRIA